MRQPEIAHINRTDDNVELTLLICETLTAFEGHFDSAPVLPGVVQIEWVVKFAQEFFNANNPLKIERLDGLKFQQVIQPNSEVTLALHRTAKSVSFAFHSLGRKHSSGKIVLE